MRFDRLYNQPQQTACPDCGILIQRLTTPGGIDFGNWFTCSCAYNRAMAEKKEGREIYLKALRKTRVDSSGLSLEHMKICGSDSFDGANPLVREAQRWMNTTQQNWFALMADSGTGKTTALTFLGFNLIMILDKRVKYYVHSELMDDLKTWDKKDFTHKATNENLLAFDILILDDFTKEDKCRTEDAQGRTKTLIDLFIRKKKIIIFGIDIDLSHVAEKFTDEYKKQVIGRIVEKCGPFAIGKNNLPNLRLQTQPMLANLL